MKNINKIVFRISFISEEKKPIPGKEELQNSSLVHVGAEILPVWDNYYPEKISDSFEKQISKFYNDTFIKKIALEIRKFASTTLFNSDLPNRATKVSHCKFQLIDKQITYDETTVLQKIDITLKPTVSPFMQYGFSFTGIIYEEILKDYDKKDNSQDSM